MQQAVDFLWLVVKLFFLIGVLIVLVGLALSILRGFVWHFRKEKGKVLGWKQTPKE